MKIPHLSVCICVHLCVSVAEIAFGLESRHRESRHGFTQMDTDNASDGATEYSYSTALVQPRTASDLMCHARIQSVHPDTLKSHRCSRHSWL